MTFFLSENGQGMIEYALILGFVSVTAVVILVVMGPKIHNMHADINNKITTKQE